MKNVRIDPVCRALNCDNFNCIYDGTDECPEDCKNCGKSICKNCESSKEGTC